MLLAVGRIFFGIEPLWRHHYAIYGISVFTQSNRL
jgi:hypothetical protein